MENNQTDLFRIISELGVASEVELQVKTMQPLIVLRGDLKKLEDDGLVRRKPMFFNRAYGDGLELTSKGFKSSRNPA